MLQELKKQIQIFWGKTSSMETQSDRCVDVSVWCGVVFMRLNRCERVIHDQRELITTDQWSKRAPASLITTTEITPLTWDQSDVFV